LFPPQPPRLTKGFGASTPGGQGQQVYHVTNLHDSGAGSLRDAVSQGNRMVVFDVAGDIVLNDFVYVQGSFITIDGLSAPGSGITLKNRGLVIRGNQGAHDVIVRGIRVRNSTIDGIQIAYGAYNIVVDHVSVSESGDGAIDITFDAHDVTVSNSILLAPQKTMLVKYFPSRISLHGNLYYNNGDRNPQVRYTAAPSEGVREYRRGSPSDTTADVRNNLVWNNGTTLIWYGPWVNVVGNYYQNSNPIEVSDGALAYVAANMTVNGSNPNNVGNMSVPFAAPAVTTSDAQSAACSVKDNAGVRPLDSVDQGYLATIAIPGCD
jgi:pectate lyase